MGHDCFSDETWSTRLSADWWTTLSDCLPRFPCEHCLWAHAPPDESDQWCCRHDAPRNTSTKFGGRSEMDYRLVEVATAQKIVCCSHVTRNMSHTVGRVRLTLLLV